MTKRVAICSVQVPFTRGGAEVLTESLAAELARRGWEVESVRLPFSWTPRLQLFRSALAWRLVDLRAADGGEIDLVIATRFPSYLIRHPNKVVWLVHQFRQVYELRGTGYSDFGSGEDEQRMVEMIRSMDERALPEARAVFGISRNTVERLRRYNGVEASVLHPPPSLGEAYREGESGDYVFAAGRLDPMKRFDLLVRALAHTRHPVRVRIAGTGPEEEALRELATRLGIADRVELLGWVSDEELVRQYAESLAVFYAPFDEDYGYVTVEAFRSGKPVLTAEDSGGVLEFVEEGRSGFVCPSGSPRIFGQRIDTLWKDRALARRMGAAGRERVAGIAWDPVIAALTGESG